ncbi:MAG: hypothetical protein HY833_00650 [Candidatus Aenigmarchaeota archaeon]|nr:hypothetical protein [Candidatus Aenigmarchaeota archaeon]
MDSKMILIAVVAVAALAAGFFVMNQSPSEAVQTVQAEKVQEDSRNIGVGVNAVATAEVTKAESPTPAEASAAHVVEMSSSGFSPDSLTVKAGETVTFLAVDGSNRWPASAFHPTHTVYPGSNIEKCGTSEKDAIFDSCGGIADGKSWSFTFGEKGSWNYHDHDDSKVFGKIIVE